MTTKQEITFAQRMTTALQKIKRLEKSGENTFAKYSFTPVDDVKDLIRPALADAGLYLSVHEVEFDLIELKGPKGSTTCAKIKFCITVSDGLEILADNITVVLPYTGAQTTGAARSYAVKEWAKATLLVSTGETGEGADADAHNKVEFSGNGEIRLGGAKNYEEEGFKMHPDDAEEMAKRLVSQIRTCKTHEELDTETKMAGFKRDLNDLQKQWPDYAKAVVDEGKSHRQKLVEASNIENFPSN